MAVILGRKPGGGGGGGGSQSVLKATVSLSTNDLLGCFASPVEIVASPGAGKVIVPLSLSSFAYLTGSVAGFGRAVNLILLVGNNPVAYTTDMLSINPDPSSPDWLTSGYGMFVGGAVGGAYVVPPAQGLLSLFEDQPLYFTSNVEMWVRGEILTWAVATPGTGYAPGDTGTVTGEAIDATYVVDTVDGGGGVLTLHFSDLGNPSAIPGQVEGTAVVTGGGDGDLEIETTTVTPATDGTGVVSVVYYVMDV